MYDTRTMKISQSSSHDANKGIKLMCIQAGGTEGETEREKQSVNERPLREITQHRYWAACMVEGICNICMEHTLREPQNAMLKDTTDAP